MNKFFDWLLRGGSRLTVLEESILGCVKSGITNEEVKSLWEKQVASINKVQRLPEAVEVNFYRIRNGKPTFNPEIAFPNKTEELEIARLEISLVNSDKKLVANVWCVKGYIFSIEYQGAASYFEEAAANMPPATNINCVLLADLAKPVL